MFAVSLKDVSRVFQKCLKGVSSVSKKFQRCYMEVSRVS